MHQRDHYEDTDLRPRRWHPLAVITLIVAGVVLFWLFLVAAVQWFPVRDSPF